MRLISKVTGVSIPLIVLTVVTMGVVTNLEAETFWNVHANACCPVVVEPPTRLDTLTSPVMLKVVTGVDESRCANETWVAVTAPVVAGVTELGDEIPCTWRAERLVTLKPSVVLVKFAFLKS